MAEVMPYGSDIDNCFVTPNPAVGRVNIKSFLSNPSDQFGGGAGLLNASGDTGIPQISSAGIQPGSTANDNVLAVFTLPAGTFDIAGRGLQLRAMGTFGATANAKTIKIIVNPTTFVVGSAVVGGTTIASSGAVTQNGGGWMLEGSIFKYGVAGSNTQIAFMSNRAFSTAVQPTAPTLLTLTESVAVPIAITGNAATAATDILFNFLQGIGYN